MVCFLQPHEAGRCLRHFPDQLPLGDRLYRALDELIWSGDPSLRRAWRTFRPGQFGLCEAVGQCVSGLDFDSNACDFSSIAKRLNRGEMDAIALAEELHAGLILMDDAAGVRFALERGLTIPELWAYSSKQLKTGGCKSKGHYRS